VEQGDGLHGGNGGIGADREGEQGDMTSIMAGKILFFWGN
jgi:hypothetical protein